MNAFVGAALCSAALSLIPVTVRADDASALLAKHRAYVGWSAAAGTSWHATGTRSDGRVSDTFAQWRRGLIFRDVLTSADGHVSIQDGFTGRAVWKSDENADFVTVFGNAARAAIDRDAILGEATSDLSGGTVGGSANVRGTATTVVRLSPAAGLPMDLYVDPQTGAYLRAVIDPQGSPQTLDIERYDSQGSMKYIAAYAMDGKRYDLSHVGLGAVADGDLLPPPVRTSWTFSSTPVAMDIFSQGGTTFQPRVRASVNGHPGVFLLRSGIPNIVLYDDFAAAAGVQSLGTSDFSSLIGNPHYRGYGLAKTMSFGGSVLQNVVVETLQTGNSHVDGILGFPFFAGAIVNVSAPKAQMLLSDPNAFTPQLANGAFAFPVDLSQFVPAFDMRVGQNATAHPVFDTGVGSFVLLSQSLRDSGKISATDSSFEYGNASVGTTGAYGPNGGSSSNRISYMGMNDALGTGSCVIAHEVYVGPYKYETPPICFVNNNVFGSDGGLVGIDFLRHFDWTFDFPHNRTILTPNGQ